MLKNLPLYLLLLVASACSQTSKKTGSSKPDSPQKFEVVDRPGDQPAIADQAPKSLMDLPQTQHGGFVLSAGFYEADFKSYCLQPGTPDPSSRDAYYQSRVTGYRKEIVETILVGSYRRPELPQRNIQLLLWSVVSGSDFNRLSPTVQSTASQLLTAKQIFELKGGVIGYARTISAMLPGNAGDNIRKVFDIGADSYEVYERMAVLKEPSVVHKPEFKRDQWYKQKDNYYIRYFPAGYQRVKIQVYVPANALDSTGKRNGEYLVYDPTGLLAMPANSNSQKLGIGAPVVDIIRKVIEIERRNPPPAPKKLPAPKTPKGASVTAS